MKEIFYGIVTFGIIFVVVFIICFFSFEPVGGSVPVSRVINTALAIGLISGVIVTFTTKKRKGQ